ncbi:36021_t:CDS:1, partial [Gigaspora margarita]
LQGLNLEVKPGQYAALICPSESVKNHNVSYYTNGTISIVKMNFEQSSRAHCSCKSRAIIV